MPPSHSKLTTFLKVDFSEKNTLWLKSSSALRRLVGILGMSLPLLLFVFLFVGTNNNLNHSLDSLSHYYYTRVCGIFVIILSLLAIFLIVYKGKKPIDFYLSTIAGVFALCVVLFPGSNIVGIDAEYAVTNLPMSDLRIGFHYVSAAIFLLCLSGMSLFLFTLSDKTPEKRGSKKILRNRIYRTCGVLIILALVVILLGKTEVISPAFYDKYHLTFWMETAAVESFGFAWLIKGETLFRD